MYPPDFVSRAKRLFPDFVYLHVMLDEGDIGVGTVLRMYCLVGLPAFSTIMAVADCQSNEKYLVACRYLAIQELYEEWMYLCPPMERTL